MDIHGGSTANPLRLIQSIQVHVCKQQPSNYKVRILCIWLIWLPCLLTFQFINVFCFLFIQNPVTWKFDAYKDNLLNDINIMATNPGGWGRGQPPIRTPRGGEYQAWERGSVGPPQGQPSTLPYIQQIGSIGKGIVEELKCALTLYSPCNIYYWTIWILNWNIVFCNLFHWGKGKMKERKYSFKQWFWNHVYI